MQLSGASSGVIRKGQRVTITLPVDPPCTGSYVGMLAYHRALRWPPFEINMDRLGVNRAASIPMATLTYTVP